MRFNYLVGNRGFDVLSAMSEVRNELIDMLLVSNLPGVAILNPNLVSPLVFTYKNDVLFQLQASPYSKDCTEIKMVYVRKDKRRLGRAREALDWLCGLADEHYADLRCYAVLCRVNERIIFSAERWLNHSPIDDHEDYCEPIDGSNNAAWADTFVRNHGFRASTEGKYLKLYRTAKNKRPEPPPPPAPIKDAWACAITGRISLVKPQSTDGNWIKVI